MLHRELKPLPRNARLDALQLLGLLHRRRENRVGLVKADVLGAEGLTLTRARTSAIAAVLRDRRCDADAENAETEYVAYVSEQNLVPDNSGEPVRHPQINEVFIRGKDGSYRMRPERQH